MMGILVKGWGQKGRWSSATKDSCFSDIIKTFTSLRKSDFAAQHRAWCSTCTCYHRRESERVLQQQGSQAAVTRDRLSLKSKLLVGCRRWWREALEFTARKMAPEGVRETRPASSRKGSRDSSLSPSARTWTSFFQIFITWPVEFKYFSFFKI